MHRRQTERVAKLRLSERQLERVAIRQPDRGVPPEQLAQQIGDPAARIPPPERDDTLAQHRLLLQAAPPQGRGNPRTSGEQVHQALTRNPRDANRRDRADRMVHRPEQEDMHVADVARYQEGHDLAPAIRHRTVANGQTLLEQERRAGLRALGDDVDVGPVRLLPLRQRVQNLAVDLRERCEMRQLADQRVIIGYGGRGWCAWPFRFAHERSELK